MCTCNLSSPPRVRPPRSQPSSSAYLLGALYHNCATIPLLGTVTVVADGFLYVDSLRVYQVNGLRLRIHSEGK